jgi:NAD(P)-dependent dehydrogenase (short-subunit alcohol dehydrogenase family)
MTQTQQSVGKKALITGGGTGIGRAAALALAAEGYEVTVAGRTAATLEQTSSWPPMPAAALSM